MPRHGLLNARSVSKRRDVIEDHITSSGLDFLAITETWLNVTHGDHILRSACPSGFSSLHVPRPLGLRCRGGGVGLIYRDAFNVKRSGQDFSPSSFEILDVSIKTTTKSLLLLVVYRPPERKGDPSFSVFMSEFRALLESVAGASQEVVITGDFNIHVDDPTCSKARSFSDLLSETGWTQLVKGLTHRAQHTLDLIIARTGSQFITGVNVSSLVSDHHLVLSSVRLCRPIREKRVISYLFVITAGSFLML